MIREMPRLARVSRRTAHERARYEYRIRVLPLRSRSHMCRHQARKRRHRASSAQGNGLARPEYVHRKTQECSGLDGGRALWTRVLSCASRFLEFRGCWPKPRVFATPSFRIGAVAVPLLEPVGLTAVHEDSAHLSRAEGPRQSGSHAAEKAKAAKEIAQAASQSTGLGFGDLETKRRTLNAFGRRRREFDVC